MLWKQCGGVSQYELMSFVKCTDHNETIWKMAKVLIKFRY